MTSAETSNVIFKFFSPLRTPISSKKKKKHKHNSKEKKEKKLTKELLQIADNISSKFSGKSSLCDTDSDAASINFDIPVSKSRLLNAHILGYPCINNSPSSTFRDSEKPSSQQNIDIEKENSDNEISLQLKEKSTRHTMGKRLIHDLSPSPKKKKSKHSKKSKKRSLDKDSISSPHVDHMIKQVTNVGMHDVTVGHATTCVTNGGNKKPSAGGMDFEQSDSGHSSDSSENVSEKLKNDSGSEESDVVSDSDNSSTGDSGHSLKTQDTKTPRKSSLPEYKMKSGFAKMNEKTGKSRFVCQEDLKNKEIWLIKSPLDLNLTDLQNQEIHLNSISSMEISESNEKFEVLTSRESSGSAVSFCPVFPSKKSWKFNTGSRIAGQLHITRNIKIPPVPSLNIQPAKRIEIPSGLKPRFQPFGADSPQSSDLSPGKKHKKGKKRKHEESPQCSDSASAKKHKKSKKRKHEENSEVEKKHKKKKKKKKD